LCERCSCGHGENHRERNTFFQHNSFLLKDIFPPIRGLI
jgi:hypothetical protein